MVSCIHHTMQKTNGRKQLTAVEALIVASEIRVAEGVAVRSIGPQRRVVSRSIVKLTVTLRMISKTVVRIARAIFRACTEAFVISSRDQRRNAVVTGRGRWWRWSIVSSVRGTAGRKYASGGNKGQSKSREFHGVLTIQFAQSQLHARSNR